MLSAIMPKKNTKRESKTLDCFLGFLKNNSMLNSMACSAKTKIIVDKIGLGDVI